MLIQPKNLFDDVGIDIMHRVTTTIFLSLIIVITVQGVNHDDNHDDIIAQHYLRAGGASAVANTGIPDHWSKRHGRWLSENAKDGYVKDKLKDRLRITRNLGL